MSEFTNGPWLYGRKSGTSNFDKSTVYRISGDHMVLADVRSGEADARLMAAAPDMYEALRAIAANGYDAETCEEIARAVLAKVNP